MLEPGPPRSISSRWQTRFARLCRPDFSPHRFLINLISRFDAEYLNEKVKYLRESYLGGPKKSQTVREQGTMKQVVIENPILEGLSYGNNEK
jgi:hypothetical protein